MKINWKEKGLFDGIDLTSEKEIELSTIFDDIVTEYYTCFCVILRLAEKCDTLSISGKDIIEEIQKLDPKKYLSEHQSESIYSKMNSEADMIYEFTKKIIKKFNIKHENN